MNQIIGHKHHILFALLMVISALALGQSGSIKGKVSSNGFPMEFVNVGIKGLAIGGITDQNGRFEINNVPFGRQIVLVSMIGFETESKSIALSAENSMITVNFSLTEKAAAIDEVVISGTMKEISKLESSVPVEVYSKGFFKANPTPSVFESLQNVNGVRPQLNCNVCNTGDIHINGLEGPYTMVLIDGMPIVSGLSTVYGLTGIPQSLIERVEIVKGPASTLYGSEAVGGLINIITKNPTSAPIAAVDVMASGWGEINTDIGLKYALGKNANALMGVNYFNYNNPIDNNNDGFTDLTLQDRISIFNKINFKRKKNRVFTLAGRYVYEDRWGGQMNWNREFRGGEEVYGESIYTNRWETFGVYQLPFEENINFQFSANGHLHNSVYGNVVYNANQYIGFGQMTWNKELAKHDFLLGAAYRYTYYDDNTPATATANGLSNKASIIHLPGIFIQDEIQLNETNKVLFGARYDQNSIHGGIFTPRINYKWNSRNKKNIVRISAGNGYRVANVFTEDHAALTGARSIEFEGELNPETSWNANLNLVKKIYTKNSSIISFDASAFYTHFSNRILPDYETDPNKIIYGNLDGFSVSQGVSLNIDLTLPQGFKALVGATLLDVSVEENGNRYQQLLTESFQGVWSLGYEFKSIDLSVDYTGNLYGPMRLPLLGELDPRDEYSPWWSVQNVQATLKLGKWWEIYGGVKNLLDFTPPANSIARAFDPFDQEVQFGADGQVIATESNPNALTFDPSYVYAANQGRRAFLGFRYTLQSRSKDVKSN